MKVFKFGGASVRNAPALDNLLEIMQQCGQRNKLLVAVSAMGKTTNALEELLLSFREKKDYQANFINLKKFHLKIVSELFKNPMEEIYTILEDCFESLEKELFRTKDWLNQDKQYDAIVAYGEILSSKIVAYFLNAHQIPCEWIDARIIIQTDESWREGKVDWEKTQENVQNQCIKILEHKIILTQGFIGGTEKGETTTLGREGSDFSAAIFAYCLSAENLTIWKDVPGVLNADPKKVAHTSLYAQLNYAEAAELTYYGASVIHPKTIEPLAKKKIPLFVKSFLYPQKPGTCINSTIAQKMIPAILFKSNQVLIHIQTKSFGFFKQDELGEIFRDLSWVVTETNLQINFLYKSAGKICICTDNRPEKIESFVNRVGESFILELIENIELITIKDAGQSVINKIMRDKERLYYSYNEGLYQAVVEL